MLLADGSTSAIKQFEPGPTLVSATDKKYEETPPLANFSSSSTHETCQDQGGLSNGLSRVNAEKTPSIPLEHLPQTSVGPSHPSTPLVESNVVSTETIPEWSSVEDASAVITNSYVAPRNLDLIRTPAVQDINDNVDHLKDSTDKSLISSRRTPSPSSVEVVSSDDVEADGSSVVPIADGMPCNALHSLENITENSFVPTEHNHGATSGDVIGSSHCELPVTETVTSPVLSPEDVSVEPVVPVVSGALELEAAVVPITELSALNQNRNKPISQLEVSFLISDI